MKPQENSQLAHLVRQREAAFVTVFECEDRIRRILRGAAVRFSPPPELPSLRRRPPAPTPVSPAEAPLRRLRDGEDAYRLTCLGNGTPYSALTADLDTVKTLCALPRQVLAVDRIDSVHLEASGEPTVVECLRAATHPAGQTAVPAGSRLG